MDKVFREPPGDPRGVQGPSWGLTPKGPSAPGLHPMAPEGLGLYPIRHKEFNEFIKEKGFKGRNNYKLRDLKAMFGF